MTKVRPPRHPTPPPYASTPTPPPHTSPGTAECGCAMQTLGRSTVRELLQRLVGIDVDSPERFVLKQQSAVRPAAPCLQLAAPCLQPAAPCLQPAAPCLQPAALCPQPAALCLQPAALCLRPAAPCLMACSPANSSPHPHVCLALTLYLAFTSPRPQVRVAEKTPLQLLHFLERMVGTEPLRVAAAEELKVCLAAEHFVYRWLALARGGGGGCGEPVLSPCARLVAGGR